MTAIRTSQRSKGLVLAPFRGVRFNPARVSGLAAVTSPPYDVIEPDRVQLLETLDPHNIVRVILPRDVEGGSATAPGRYRHAAETLKSWLADGVLLTDHLPSLYVYEQVTPTTVQRGLIGALGLRQLSDGVVLAHEDVMPGPVADRFELMRAIQANPDPILMTYEGGGAASEIVERICTTKPLVELRTPDGISHRLWTIIDAGVIADIRRDLGKRRAMIADGHHRYATYLRLQATSRAAGRGPGPWDYGLALLVDDHRHPLELKAIHRVLPKVRPEEVVARLSRWCVVRRVPGAEPDVALLAEPALAGTPAYLFATSHVRWLVTGVDAGLIDASFPPHRPEAWRRLDASVLHHVIFDRILELPDDPEHITYHHGAADAVRLAGQAGGVAVLMRAVHPAVVASLAASGVRMPHKSTSFGPKPRTGIILRTFAAG